MPPVRKSVAGIAFEDGRFFIARRNPGGSLGGKWEFPGGKVEPGEDDEAALRREYAEEFGLSIETGSVLASSSFTHKGQSFRLNAYRVRIDTGGLRLAEHSEWRWASLGEIKKLDFAGSDRGLFPALEAYFEQDNNIKN